MLKLSVVTPNLNGMPYISECLDSIERERPDQYVIVDGGSTDGSLDILSERSGLIDQLLTGSDDGMYDALNKGFAICEHDILGYINVDDFYLPGALNCVREVFSRFPQVQWLTTSYAIGARADGALVHCKRIDPFLAKYYNQGLYLGVKGIGNCQFIPQEATFWRRDLWDSVGGFDRSCRLAGDYVLWSRFFEHAELYHMEMPLAVYRSRHGQLSSDIDAYLDECRSKKCYSNVRPITRAFAELELCFRKCFKRYPRIKYSIKESRWCLSGDKKNASHDFDTK